MRHLGFTLAILPLACWSWTLRDPCGLQGQAWRERWDAARRRLRAASVAEALHA